ncbi:hypothetical protein E2C01_004534 [Portunus trituberculatus]|uniref:Uncharacterized protein n=1 Tax=Portunus trituberculatus TaxID=210409 RepID=A0A5B7CQS3_PORTR|nr:hypothetical protein [Portunus trituberculatus]
MICGRDRLHPRQRVRTLHPAVLTESLLLNAGSWVVMIRVTSKLFISDSTPAPPAAPETADNACHLVLYKEVLFGKLGLELWSRQRESSVDDNGTRIVDINKILVLFVRYLEFRK